MSSLIPTVFTLSFMFYYGNPDSVDLLRARVALLSPAARLFWQPDWRWVSDPTSWVIEVGTIFRLSLVFFEFHLPLTHNWVLEWTKWGLSEGKSNRSTLTWRWRKNKAQILHDGWLEMSIHHRFYCTWHTQSYSDKGWTLVSILATRWHVYLRVLGSLASSTPVDGDHWVGHVGVGSILVLPAHQSVFGIAPRLGIRVGVSLGWFGRGRGLIGQVCIQSHTDLGQFLGKDLDTWLGGRRCEWVTAALCTYSQFIITKLFKVMPGMFVLVAELVNFGRTHAEKWSILAL